MLQIKSQRTEGEDHINAYSKSTLLLGRELSNFFHSPIELPDDGKFASIEAYWFWLWSHDDSLRPLHGVEAKHAGTKAKKRSKITISDELFESKIKKAIEYKLKQNLSILHALKESTLPIVHYYVMPKPGRKGSHKVEMVNRHTWIWHHYECLRAKLRGEPEPPYIPPPKPDEDNNVLPDGTMSLF